MVMSRLFDTSGDSKASQNNVIVSSCPTFPTPSLAISPAETGNASPSAYRVGTRCQQQANSSNSQVQLPELHMLVFISVLGVAGKGVNG
jgi:hypothetical protein